MSQLSLHSLSLSHTHAMHDPEEGLDEALHDLRVAGGDCRSHTKSKTTFVNQLSILFHEPVLILQFCAVV
jgi:hypothetical protein